jgi:hypothetical protein
MKIYVVDTSYLDELLRVPKFYTDQSFIEVNNRFRDAITSHFRLYVPLPCIFELGNHIANCSNGDTKRDLVDKLVKMVSSSILESIPFTIIPATSMEDFLRLFQEFANTYSVLRISLTDSFIIQEAKRLKNEHREKGYSVHIWTRDQNLKAYEPDPEENSFV